MIHPACFSRERLVMICHQVTASPKQKQMVTCMLPWLVESNVMLPTKWNPRKIAPKPRLVILNVNTLPQWCAVDQTWRNQFIKLTSLPRLTCHQCAQLTNTCHHGHQTDALTHQNAPMMRFHSMVIAIGMKQMLMNNSLVKLIKLLRLWKDSSEPPRK
jgi:hypothetical protein